MPRLDFTNVTSDFEAIPAGIYEATVFDCEEKMSKTNNPMLVFNYAIQGGEFDARRIFDNCSLQPQALFKLKEAIEAILDQDASGEIDITPIDFVGKPCKIKVIQEEYEGRMQNRVKKIYPIDYDGTLAKGTSRGGSAATVARPAAKPAPAPMFGKKKTGQKPVGDDN